MTAAVIGGTAITGGFGSPIGTALRRADVRHGQPGLFLHRHRRRLVLRLRRRHAARCRGDQQLCAGAAMRPGAVTMTDAANSPLLAARGIRKSFGAVGALLAASRSRSTRRRGDLPSRRQRRRQVDADQDPLGRRACRTRARSGCRRRARRVHLGARRARPRHRHRLPGPRGRSGDAGLPQLLPRPRAEEGRALSAVSTRTAAMRIAAKEIAPIGIDVGDVNAADHDAVRRRAAVRRDRPRRSISARRS